MRFLTGSRSGLWALSMVKHPIIADQNSVGLGQGRAQLFRPDLSSANGVCVLLLVFALCMAYWLYVLLLVWYVANTGAA